MLSSDPRAANDIEEGAYIIVVGSMYLDSHTSSCYSREISVGRTNSLAQAYANSCVGALGTALQRLQLFHVPVLGGSLKYDRARGSSK